MGDKRMKAITEAAMMKTLGFPFVNKNTVEAMQNLFTTPENLVAGECCSIKPFSFGLYAYAGYLMIADWSKTAYYVDTPEIRAALIASKKLF